MSDGAIALTLSSWSGTRIPRTVAKAGKKIHARVIVVKLRLAATRVTA